MPGPRSGRHCRWYSTKSPATKSPERTLRTPSGTATHSRAVLPGRLCRRIGTGGDGLGAGVAGPVQPARASPARTAGSALLTEPTPSVCRRPVRECHVSAPDVQEPALAGPAQLLAKALKHPAGPGIVTTRAQSHRIRAAALARLP